MSTKETAMSTELKNQGGPAFPTPTPDLEEGMTLRDYYAGQALVGLLSGQYSSAGSSTFNLEEVPEESYKIADAMLAARDS